MGSIKQHRPVLLIAAVTSQYAEAFEWGKEQVSSEWGSILRVSDRFEFSETSYYEKSMGSGLSKQFWIFDELIDPGLLPDTKIFSNHLEENYASRQNWNVDRPINIDPGYITEAKLVLATTKDRDHRIYLDKGIYAEVTLYFNQGQWKSRPWTYPDYQRTDFQEFFSECRTELRNRYRELDRAELDENDFR